MYLVLGNVVSPVMFCRGHTERPSNQICLIEIGCVKCKHLPNTRKTELQFRCIELSKYDSWVGVSLCGPYVIF